MAESTSSLADTIVSIVRKYDYVTFAELPRRLSDRGHTNTSGDSSIELPGNLVLWAGLSVELVEAIRGLLSTKRLFLHPATTSTYMIDGGLLTLPIAKRAMPKGYRNPHWLPVCLRTVPIAAKRKGRQ